MKSKLNTERVMQCFREKQLIRQTTPKPIPDTFFTQTHCDRCKAPLTARTMSWFNNETICVDKCAEEEKKLRTILPKVEGDYEGCGYVPTLSEGIVIRPTLPHFPSKIKTM